MTHLIKITMQTPCCNLLKHPCDRTICAIKDGLDRNGLKIPIFIVLEPGASPKKAQASINHRGLKNMKFEV